MNEFDDRDVRDALRRRAGAPTDGYGLEAARTAVVARAGLVRRRRAVVAGSSAMAAVIATAVLVIGPGTDSVVTTPADPTDESVPSSVDATPSTNPDRTGPDRTIATAPPSSTAPSPATTIPAVGPPTVIAPTTTATLSPQTTVSAAPTTPEPTPATSVTPTSTTPSGPAPFTETYTSGGGSIVVRWDGTALILQSVTEAAGFEFEVEDNRADRIRVRFRGDDGDLRIEIRFENGAIVRVE